MDIYCITQVFVKSSFIEPKINHSNMELSTDKKYRSNFHCNLENCTHQYQ